MLPEHCWHWLNWPDDPTHDEVGVEDAKGNLGGILKMKKNENAVIYFAWETKAIEQVQIIKLIIVKNYKKKYFIIF